MSMNKLVKLAIGTGITVLGGSVVALVKGKKEKTFMLEAPGNYESIVIYEEDLIPDEQK